MKLSPFAVAFAFITVMHAANITCAQTTELEAQVVTASKSQAKVEQMSLYTTIISQDEIKKLEKEKNEIFSSKNITDPEQLQRILDIDNTIFLEDNTAYITNYDELVLRIEEENVAFDKMCAELKAKQLESLK